MGYGVLYGLQYRERTFGQAGAWADLGEAITGDCEDNVFLDGGDTLWLAPDSPDIGMRFYRLQVVEP